MEGRIWGRNRTSATIDRVALLGNIRAIPGHGTMSLTKTWH